MPTRSDAPPARALASLYCRPDQRQALAALVAIEREIATSLLAGIDHDVAHARLAWWREECGRCAAGGAVHPLTRQLAAIFSSQHRTALGGLAGLVDVAAWDLACATFDSRLDLEACCDRWSAAVIEPLAHLPSAGAPPALLRAFGQKLRELELLLAIAADAQLGRLRWPLDELARAGVTPEELARPPWGAALAGLLRERHRRLRSELAATVDALGPAGQSAWRGPIVWTALLVSHSRRAEALLPRAIAAGDHQAPLDGWRAWRAARRADAGRGLAGVD